MRHRHASPTDADPPPGRKTAGEPVQRRQGKAGPQGLLRTVPTAVSLAWHSRWTPWPGTGDTRDTRPGWRDEAGLLAAVVGAMTINLVPAAWTVVGHASGQFLMFALMIAVTWTVCTALQIATLRWVRAGGRTERFSVTAQFACVAATGAAFSLIFSTPMNPYEEGLGLNGVDAWGSGVYAAWSSVLVAAFLVWHREGRQRQTKASQRLRSVQEAQFGLRRSLVESQLQAVQARIDPQHFFDTLDATQALYRRDVTAAEALFDELIVFLRAALPSLDSASSVLAREFDLATSCVRMHALATGQDIGLDIDADRALRRLAFPAGLLLPLLRGLLQAGSPWRDPSCPARSRRRIELSARLETPPGGPDALVLAFTADAPPDAAALQRARATLRSLFGAAASLGCTPPCDRRVTTHLRIDHALL